MLLAWNGPQVVQRRLGDLRHPGNEGRSPIRLDTNRGTVAAVDMDFGVNTWLLRHARHDGTKAAVLEPEHRNSGIVHLDPWMIDVGPAAADFRDRPQEPAEQVELVRRLIDQHPTAFGIPLPPPRVGLIIGRFSPTVHEEEAEGRPANLA